MNSIRTTYKDKFQLLNSAEQALYERLAEAAPAFVVCPQVSMSQIFWIRRYIKGHNQQLNEIGKKSIDFVLCRRDDWSIAVAVEMNGKDHDKPEQQERDEKKRIALEEAGIPLVIIKPDAIPDKKTMGQILAPYVVQRMKYEEQRDNKPKKN